MLFNGAHCSSTRSTAPVSFWRRAASWARYKSNTGTPRDFTSFSVKEFIISKIHTGRFLRQFLVTASKIYLAWAERPEKLTVHTVLCHLMLVATNYKKVLRKRETRLLRKQKICKRELLLPNTGKTADTDEPYCGSTTQSFGANLPFKREANKVAWSRFCLLVCCGCFYLIGYKLNKAGLRLLTLFWLRRIIQKFKINTKVNSDPKNTSVFDQFPTISQLT